ncbi:transposase, partial [Enterococcus faecalis]|uniref:transposase n=1 Tax=Enterococcus faecalis TaxID=1351 RepID=UPI0039A4F496
VWNELLQDIYSRGVHDVLLFITDGLKGMKDTIHQIYPKAKYQYCCVHVSRNISHKVRVKDRKEIITMANHAMVSSARSVDAALEFDTETYFWLSLGLLILILAISSFSFFASTLFNRSGLALAIGGGIPFAFFLLTMVQQLMDDAPVILEYLTITTLFDTDAILASGEFGWGLVALGTIAFVLYAASNVIFTKKDLPL